MSHPAEQALLRAILEDPEDDTPRLVYADWLEENGQGQDQARALFIRLQIQAASFSRKDTNSGVKGTECRESDLDEPIQRLWEEYRVAWFGPAAAECDVRLCERGFIARPSAGGWARSVQAAGRWSEQWPLGPVAGIEVDYAPEDDEPDDANPEVLQALPGLASWGGLHLYKLNTEQEHERLLTLLRSAHLTGLRRFDAVRSAVGDQGIAALAEAPAGFRLRRLRLDSCGVGEAGLQHLADAPAFSQLRELTLCEQIPEAAIARLLTAPNLHQLETLDLCSWDTLGSVTLEALVTSPCLRSLRSLTLGPFSQMLASGGGERLATWPGLANLRSLTFDGDNGLTEEGLRALVASPHLGTVQKMGFIHCGCLPALLAELPGLASLRRLEINDSDLRTQTARRLRKVLRDRFGARVEFFGSGVPGDPG